MRDFKGMKRQRGRNRGGGGNKPQQQNANRAFDSNGPEGVKVRGAAQSVFEKYQQLARDASSSGDRVLAENYLQHAEHYFRTLRAMQPHRPVADIVGREQFASGFDIDFEAEPEPAPEAPEVADTPDAEGEEGQRDNREGRRDRFENRRDRDRDDRPRDRDRDRDDRPRDRDDRQRDDRPRDDRPRDDRPREDRGERSEGGRRERWRDRDDRRDRDRDRQDRAAEGARDPLPVIEPQAAPLAEAAPEESPRLRGQDGAVSELPAFLGRPAPAEARDEPTGEVKKPRRRRAPRSFEGGEGAPAETEDA